MTRSRGNYDNRFGKQEQIHSARASLPGVGGGIEERAPGARGRRGMGVGGGIIPWSLDGCIGG